MTFTRDYPAVEPARADIDRLDVPAVLEFGTAWCGYCRRAQSDIAAALEARPDLRHIKVADGAGQPLGRLFGVTLWPTLVFLDRGREVARIVRPASAEPIRAAIAKLGAARDDDMR